MLIKKSLVKITKEFSEKILNGLKMDQELPLLLMLSISEFLDITYIIPKLMPIPLFLELSLFTTLNLPTEDPLTVSSLLMMNLITGLFVPLMELPLLIGSALFLKLLDYLALKKEKVKKKLKKS
jgi:hypothetical protein